MAPEASALKEAEPLSCHEHAGHQLLPDCGHDVQLTNMGGGLFELNANVSAPPIHSGNAWINRHNTDTCLSSQC